MRNFTGLAPHINSKNECSSKHGCCWESLAHGLYVCQPLRTLGIENEFISAAQECGAEELEEASSLSGNTLSGNDIHKKQVLCFLRNFTKRNQQQGSSPLCAENIYWLLMCYVVV